MQVFHEEAWKFLEPQDIHSGDSICIRLQQGRVEKTQWSCYVSVDVLKKGEKRWDKLSAVSESEYGGFIYKEFRYECKGPFLYHFRVDSENGTMYYGKNGLQSSLGELRSFYAMADYQPPAWARGAIWYQIMPDSFFNGCLLNDKTTSGGNLENAWGNMHFGGNDYFGGDLKGIIKKLPYIEGLGANIISINPIWLTTHQAGYGAYDPTQVDSAFGNEQDFIDLVKQCHARGIRVVLDAVFQYFNNEGIWSNDSGYFPLSVEPYSGVFMRELTGKRIESPWKAPLLDFSSDLTRDLIYRKEDSILQKYLREPYNCDGWRLDVGNIWEGSDPAVNGNSEEILKDIHDYIKSVGQDKLILTEHDCGNMMLNYTLDSKWNYDLGWKLRDWVERKLTATEMAETIRDGVMDLPRAIADCSYNHLTTHDTKRIKRHAGKSRARLKAGVVLYMTVPGSPCIYYGDEIGMEGAPLPGMNDAAPISFSSMNWNEADWDGEVYCLYRSMGALRAKKKELFERGAYRVHLTDDRRKILVFSRRTESDFLIAALNQTDKTYKNVSIDLNSIGITGDETVCDYITGRQFAVKSGVCLFDIAPGGSIFTADAVPVCLNDMECSGAAMYRANRYIFREAGALKKKAFGAFRCALRSPKQIVVRLAAGDNAEVRVEVCPLDTKVFAGGVLVAESKISDGGVLWIERDMENILRVAVERGGVRSGITEIKTQLPQVAEISIEGQYGSSTGFAQESLEQPLSADFSRGASCMFSVESGNEDRIEYTSEGVAVQTEGEVCFRSVRGYGDFCWTAKFADIRGKAGIFVGEDRHNCVAVCAEQGGVACLIYRDGREEVVTKSAARAEYFRLEKTGARYRALISENGQNFTVLAESVPCNFSVLSVGLLFAGRAVCEYAAYGSELPGIADCENVFGGKGNSFECAWERSAYNSRHVRWRCAGGEWRYTSSGLAQVSGEGGTLYTEDRYRHFKLEFTFERKSCKELEIAFAPYAIRIAEGRGTYRKDEREIASFPVGQGETVRYLLVRDAYGVKFYAGQEYTPVFRAECGEEPARVEVRGKSGTFCVYNYNIFHMEQEWALCRGGYLYRKEGLEINAVGYDTAFCMFSRYTLGELVLGVNIKAAQSASEKDGYIDFVFGNSVGSFPSAPATALRVGFDRNIRLLANGREVAAVRAAQLDLESFAVAISVQRGRAEVWIKEYLGAEQRQIFSCEDSALRAGGLTVCVKGGKAILSHMTVSEGNCKVPELQVERGRYVWLS